MREATAAALRGEGIDVPGTVTGASYDALVAPSWRRAEVAPWARSVLLLGWSGHTFGRELEASPEWADRQPDPVDRFARRRLTAVIARLDGLGERLCFFSWQRRSGVYADVVALARHAGLGAPGRHGILLHPRFGSWWALRGWALVEADLGPRAPEPLEEWDPCRGCPAPCAEACPAAAVTAAGLDGGCCAAFQAASDACARLCHARAACPVGAEYAHSPQLEARFRAAARAALGAPAPWRFR